MNIFLSWSGEKSKKVAKVFDEYLPKMIQACDTFFSEDMDKGTLWFPEINEKLEKCDVGIICITRNNMKKPWVLFESGALAMTWEDGKERVCPFLFDLNNSDLEGPLTEFQLTENNEGDIFKLVKTINNHLEEPLHEDNLRDIYERYIEDLKNDLDSIEVSEVSDEPVRDDREVLEEILTHVRDMNKNLREDREIETENERLSQLRGELSHFWEKKNKLKDKLQNVEDEEEKERLKETLTETKDKIDALKREIATTSHQGTIEKYIKDFKSH